MTNLANLEMQIYRLYVIEVCLGFILLALITQTYNTLPSWPAFKSELNWKLGVPIGKI